MSNFTATTKLMQAGSERESLLSLRNLKIKSRLQKEREELNKALKDKVDRQQRRRQTGSNVLGALAGGGAGIGIIKRFRPRRPTATTGVTGTRKFKIFRTKPSISQGGRVNTNILRNGSKLNSLLTVAFTGYDFLDRKASGQTNIQAGAGSVATTGGALAGGAAGAKIGALIGSFIVPGAGTVVGGTLGGLLGSFIGATSGSNIADSITGADAETRRKLELKKLEFQKGSTLFGSALDKFDVVLDKFARLRQDDFDGRRPRRDFAIPAPRQGGLSRFINRFARPKPFGGSASGETSNIVNENEFDVTNLEQKPRNFKEQLQREGFILKKIIQNSPRIFKESVDQTIKEYIDAFTDPTNILINLLLIKFAGGRGVGKVKIPRNLINVTPGSINNPFPNLGANKIVIPKSTQNLQIPFINRGQPLNKDKTISNQDVALNSFIATVRQIRSIEFRTNKVLDENRKLVRRISRKKFKDFREQQFLIKGARQNILDFAKKLSKESANFKNNKEIMKAYEKAQRRLGNQAQRYREKISNITNQLQIKQINTQSKKNVKINVDRGKDKVNLSDIKVSDIDKTTQSMFKKLRDGTPLDDNETKLYDSYIDYLNSIGEPLNSDDYGITNKQKKIGGPGGDESRIPRNFRKFKKTKKFKDLISFNTIHEGNNTTNLSIDDSISLASIGGGSSINMMEINGYMSV